MEEQSLIPETLECENCRKVNSATQKFCSTCSFPIGGTKVEQQDFRTVIGNHKLLLRDTEEKIKSAKTIIYILAGLVFVTGLIQFFASDDFAAMIVNLSISLLYLILAAWSDKNPFGAILTAFIIYLTLHIVNAFVEPSTLFQGIIIKIIFIGAFIKGIRSAKEAHEHIEKLKRIKPLAPVGND